MSELEQYQQELSELEEFIPRSSGGNYILLTDRKEQLTGKISELSLQQEVEHANESNDSGTGDGDEGTSEPTE